MRTKDFIKMLQEADPTGEAYIRWGEGVPYYAELKDGYWDGPFSYINEDGQYVDSIAGMKVDIYTKTPEDIVTRVVETEWNPYLDSTEGLWDKVLKKFKFEYGGYAIESQRSEREERFLKEPKEHFEWLIRHEKDSWDKYLVEMTRKAKEGWEFYQVQDSKLKYYDWQIKMSDGNWTGANLATTYPILESGKFHITESDIPATKVRPKSYWQKLLSRMKGGNDTDKRLNKDKLFVKWELI